MTTKPKPKPTKSDDMKTSSAWLNSEEFKNTTIIEPLGWDADNWVVDFVETEITREEFLMRLLKSKIKVIE